ncbi:MAG: PIN domain-containing protein [Okeania sp. SIO3B5]|uniref:hypothetical protein n=1 Tax=Okeania sp. SIO3B5 TaxID=2607811 RepID=UPI0013FFAA4C|nr:hypothetical protein [Okeania sp. SIO3B5]NEO55100.1 PIN domain-containing protein [Okeania sp. SIO3B5]
MNNRNKLVFIDSNIWLYCFLSGQVQDPEEDARKRMIANSITDVEGIVISTQVLGLTNNYVYVFITFQKPFSLIYRLFSILRYSFQF